MKACVANEALAARSAPPKRRLPESLWMEGFPARIEECSGPAGRILLTRAGRSAANIVRDFSEFGSGPHFNARFTSGIVALSNQISEESHGSQIDFPRKPSRTGGRPPVWRPTGRGTPTKHVTHRPSCR